MISLSHWARKESMLETVYFFLKIFWDLLEELTPGLFCVAPKTSIEQFVELVDCWSFIPEQDLLKYFEFFSRFFGDRHGRSAGKKRKEFHSSFVFGRVFLEHFEMNLRFIHQNNKY